MRICTIQRIFQLLLLLRTSGVLPIDILRPQTLETLGIAKPVQATQDHRSQFSTRYPENIMINSKAFSLFVESSEVAGVAK